jgi:DNA primase
MYETLSPVDVLEERLDRFERLGEGQAQSLCPFHQERNPSFRVNVDPASESFLLFLCNGCGERGGGKKLLLLLLGPGSEGLVNDLLPRYKITGIHASKRKAKGSVYLSEAILALYTGWELSELEHSGFKRETLGKFEAGYDENQDAYTYPIRDENAKLVGIYKRSHSGRGGKYKPYGPRDFPEGLIPRDYRFHKGLFLWNLHRALQESPRKPVVVVEGMKALMWVDQWLGHQVRTVALLGMSMSRIQEQKLHWLGGPFWILLDNTSTATVNANKIATRLREAGFASRVLRYGASVPQPDDLNEDQLRKTIT